MSNARYPTPAPAVADRSAQYLRGYDPGGVCAPPAIRERWEKNTYGPLRPPRAVEKGAFSREVRNTLMRLRAGTMFNAPKAALRRPFRPSPSVRSACAGGRRNSREVFGAFPCGAFALRRRGVSRGLFRSAGESLADPIFVTRQRNPHALRGPPLHHPVRIFTPSGRKNGAGTIILTFSCADRCVPGLRPGVDAGGWGQRKVGRR